MSDPMAMEVERLRPKLLAVAYRMLGTAADAEDAVQDAFLRYQRHADEVASPEAWLASQTMSPWTPIVGPMYVHPSGKRASIWSAVYGGHGRRPLSINDFSDRFRGLVHRVHPREKLLDVDLVVAHSVDADLVAGDSLEGRLRVL